jgi:hypothetical protein
MRQVGGLGNPILFWLITAGLGGVVSQLFALLFQGAMMSVVAASGNSNARSQAMATMGMTGAMGIVIAVVIPIIWLVFLFIYAGLSHLCLMMLKAANRPYETTFRTLAYAFGGAGVLSFIPVCGVYAAMIWALVAACIGMGAAQETTTGKGVAGVLLPVAVCCIGGIAFYAVIIGMAVASAPHSSASFH